MAPRLAISVLGELQVRRAGEAVPLPSSKRTRALLAYLALTGRPHRRERLCELLWDVPDDPRGAVRWSLSKLRAVVNENGLDRIHADRERAALDMATVDVDLIAIRRAIENGDDLSVARLERMEEALATPLLDGYDLPRQESYQFWLIEERAEAERLRLAVIKRLCEHPDLEPVARPRYGRRWLEIDPLSEPAALFLAHALQALGRVDEARSVIAAFNRTAQASGVAPIEETPRIEAHGAGRRVADHPIAPPSARQLLKHQTISFCTAPDGVRIAYASVGDGPPVVKTANWLNHLELDWDSPIWGKTFQSYARGRRFIRYDERGNGLSDWEVEDLSFNAFVEDLETVVDALGLDRFPLIGMSQGCAVSIDYAVRHPERVSALVLIGGYAHGWRIGASEEEIGQREAVMTLTYHGWGQNNPAYRHIFSQTFMPNATADELAWFDEFQRQTTSPANAVRFLKVFADIDVRHLLGAVGVPTLVLHSRHDRRVPLAQGRMLAVGIPNARLVTLESENHIILGHDPAWEVMTAEIGRFLIEHGG
ncbi:alpha/beta hydrolase [Pararhizobium haloflavum]|uniref:alpha/beta hydrolase n=1 Tax=Pararhizobium haloflavum TaxID=2037914 RepID=UPI000C1A6281|nr:alpha/beta hydrolase [Pararhizobium haloflavum]